MFLQETCTHQNNPTGAALATVETGIACAPIDPLDKTQSQMNAFYPLEKLLMMRQTFTKYTAFENGDYLVADSVTYAVRSVHRYDLQGSMDAYYHLILEQQIGS